MHTYIIHAYCVLCIVCSHRVIVLAGENYRSAYPTFRRARWLRPATLRAEPSACIIWPRERACGEFGGAAPNGANTVVKLALVVALAVAPGWDNTGRKQPYCVLYVLLLYFVLIRIVLQQVQVL